MRRSYSAIYQTAQRDLLVLPTPHRLAVDAQSECRIGMAHLVHDDAWVLADGIERRAAILARPAGRDVGHTARMNAAREVAERIGAQLTDEQDIALLVLTGPERATVLVGPAGTGKGVVIDAAARAEQLAGRETIGIAVSGSTAERLGADSPALHGTTLTLDALTARANTGSVHVGPDTTIILDEAGMVDHKRLDALTGVVERSGAKLIAVGDGKQLPSIGPGGMFDRLSRHAPTVELETIHRTTDPQERRALQALRAGKPERAMAHRARPSIVPSCLPAAGKQRRPPTYRPPVPAIAPTGTSAGTSSAKKDKTPTGSHASPDG